MKKHISLPSAATNAMAGSPGQSKSYVKNLGDLFATVDGLPSSDAERAVIKEYKLHVTIECDAAAYPTAGFLIAQVSAGNFPGANTTDLTDLADLMAYAASDEVGYEIISPLRKIRRFPDNTETRHYASFTVVLPARIINLLNKETQTERLQDLYLAAYGSYYYASDNIIFYIIEEITYVLKAKPITLR